MRWLCVTCGTTLAEVAPEETDNRETRAQRYDYRYGETDLSESSLMSKGRVLSTVLIILLAAAIVLTVTVYLNSQTNDMPAIDAAIPTLSPNASHGAFYHAGPLPRQRLRSVPYRRRHPATLPRPAPCTRRVAEGDSLIAIILRCGHSNLGILPTVITLNNIADETRIQIGQEIIVPLPSATADPAATPKLEDSAATTKDDELTRLAFDPFAPTLTPTLLPGLMWYVVQADDDMIYVAAIHEINVKTLSDLNPEIEFNLCDFGEVYGGPGWYGSAVCESEDPRTRLPRRPQLSQQPHRAAKHRHRLLQPPSTRRWPQSPADEAFFSTA